VSAARRTGFALLIRVSLERISRAVWPVVLATLIPLAITTCRPGLILWLPRLYAR
jgi:TRAP-type C4-dicarboxylate transport system permease large subunit